MFLQTIPPEIHYNKGWAHIIDYTNTFGLISVGALLLLGLSPLFAEDHAAKTDEVIISCQHGRQCLAWAKIITALIYCVTVLLFFTLANVITNACLYGLQGAESSLLEIYKYRHSPFAFTLWQYFGVQLLTASVAALAFGLFTAAISALTRSSLLTFFFSGGVFGLPVAMTSILGIRRGWIPKIARFSYTEFLKVESLYQSFSAYNIFGRPILHVHVAFALMLFSIVITITLISQLYKRYQIN